MKNELIVKTEQDRTAVRDYLEASLGLSSRQIKKLLKEKKITINGKAAYRDNNVKPGDRVAVDLTETAADGIAPQDIPLDIIYEDEYLLAVNKPPYMLMHPTRNHSSDTLANAVKHYFAGSGLDAPVRFLSRLDMNTSGVVIVPKQAMVHSSLMKQMEENGIGKKYLAVVQGKVVPAEGEINEPIGVDTENPIKRAVSKSGSEAVTRYKTLKTLDAATVLEVGILTGRTHQIRVHMSYLGHPLIGDELYGSRSGLIDRQALHAHCVSFVHPETGVLTAVTAPIPEDIEQLIGKLSNIRI